MNNKSTIENHSNTFIQLPADTSFNEAYTLNAKFQSFDTTIQVLFWNTKDSINDVQKRNYEGFIEKQDLLTPVILQKVFEYYQQSYQDYKIGWTLSGNISEEELEKYLPKPTTPEKLKAFIKPAVIYIQSKPNAKEGTIGVEFECTWDVEHGLGVLIRDWKVVEAGPAEIVYF